MCMQLHCSRQVKKARVAILLVVEWCGSIIIVQGLNLIFFSLKLIILHCHIQEQRQLKLKPRKNLNHGKYAFSTQPAK